MTDEDRAEHGGKPTGDTKTRTQHDEEVLSIIADSEQLAKTTQQSPPEHPTIAIFRPNDERLSEAIEILESRDVTPVADPMLAIESTGRVPRRDADFTILTSKTGAEIVAEQGWDPGEAALCAIGSKTASALEEHGFDVDHVPDEYTSSGLVESLTERVAGRRVEIARSDHGSAVLIDGLIDAGAYVHETVLYRLVRPDGSGHSMTLAAERGLDAACFTSSLTVDHALEAAKERAILEEAVTGLDDAIVGVIGEPTRKTAESRGIDVDVVASEATAETLIDEVCLQLGDE